ncbi:MAG: M13 family metallopeptidase [Lachnospiraceae bacterium]|nr:M13 family metallopeptidase [Lachnospiraceae bacterium]
MKKKILAIILSAALLVTGCGASSGAASSENASAPETAAEAESGGENADAAEKEAAEEEEDPNAVSDQNEEGTPEIEEGEDGADDSYGVTTGGSPWIDSEIRENLSEDMPTDPKDDFHLYANKEWLLKNTIPDGYTSWSHYAERGLEVTEQCIELLKDETIEGHDADLIRTYNSLLLDWDARSKSGVSEIQEGFDEIRGLKSLEELNALFLDDEYISGLFDFFSRGSGLGLENTGSYLVLLDAPETLLRDSAEYPERSEYGDMIHGYYKDLFCYIAQKLGMTEEEAEACFDSAIDFEAQYADAIMTTDDMYSEDYYDRINNIMTWEEASSLTDAVPIGQIMEKEGYKYDGEYLVMQPDYFKKLGEVYTEENFAGIRDRVLVDYVMSFRKSLDRDTYEFLNDTYNGYFGSEGMVEDDQMAYETVVEALPSAMQKVYLAKYGSEEDRKKVEDLCKMVMETYREMLSENEWASEETVQYAIEKLDKMKIHAAYPDKFRDLTELDLNDCSLLEAEDRISRYELAYDVSLVGTEVDREMWAEGFNILECNAFYDLGENTINMIIGMMGEPFFSDDMSTEELYASMGAFWIGHEISHAFDSNGAQFDADGNYADWWTEEDYEKFSERISKLDDYLDTIVAFGDYSVIGSNVDTEMAADITGLQCALRMASRVENFDYDVFFTKYAQMNASLAVYSGELSQLTQDEHPLDYLRTNVPVQQFEEFYTTYGVAEGDNMYLAPEDRLTIW